METSEVEVTLSDRAAVARTGDDSADRHSQAAHETFSRVHEDRMKRCLPLDQARGQVEDYVQHCRDYKDVQIRQLEVVGKDVKFNNRLFMLSDTAITNIAGFGGRAIIKHYGRSDCNPGYRALRAYYVRPDPDSRQIFEKIANDFLKHIADDRRALVRTYERGDDRRIDALLTDRYGIIDNLWFLDVLARNVVGGSFCRFRSDGRTISGYYFIPDSVRMELPDYGGALGVRNSEVGKASLFTQPSVFDWISGGGCVFGEHSSEALRRVHRGNIDTDQLEEMVVKHINEQIPLFDACIQQLETLKNIGLDGDIIRKTIVDVGTQHNITQEEQRMWWVGVQAETDERKNQANTAFAMVTGLMRASQDTEGSGRDMELDILAGRLASPERRDKGDLVKSWERIIKRASTVSDEKVEKVFSV